MPSIFPSSLPSDSNQVIMADLEKDVRKMMLPNTALSLRVRGGGVDRGLLAESGRGDSQGYVAGRMLCLLNAESGARGSSK